MVHEHEVGFWTTSCSNVSATSPAHSFGTHRFSLKADPCITFAWANQLQAEAGQQISSRLWSHLMCIKATLISTYLHFLTSLHHLHFMQYTVLHYTLVMKYLHKGINIDKANPLLSVLIYYKTINNIYKLLHGSSQFGDEVTRKLRDNWEMLKVSRVESVKNRLQGATASPQDSADLPREIETLSRGDAKSAQRDRDPSQSRQIPTKSIS